MEARASSLCWRNKTAGLTLALCVWGCAPRAPDFDYRFILRVEGDPGTPLAGAVVRLGALTAGISDTEGLVPLATHGSEGSALGLQVSCPDGYRSPDLPVSVLLRKVAQPNRYPEYRVSCPPTRRALVVAVRAEHAPNLPIMRLGREVARTDATGSAHVLVESAPEDTVELTLDTSSNPRLRPRSPSARFRVGHADDIVVFNQSFELEKPKLVGHRPPAGPIRIH